MTDDNKTSAPQNDEKTRNTFASVKEQNGKNLIVAQKKEKAESFRLYRFLRVLLRPIGKILWPTKVVNKKNINKIEGGLIICNHYSKVDALIPVLEMLEGEAHILAKYELFQLPIAGWFLRKMGGIPVHRGDADIDAVKSVLTVLKSNKKLLLFPEGTRNKAGTQKMGEFKEGTARFAIKTKSPIVPMIYYGMPRNCRKNYLYVGEPFTLEQFYGARTQEQYKAATEYIYQKMLETRQLCNEYVANIKGGKMQK